MAGTINKGYQPLTQIQLDLPWSRSGVPLIGLSSSHYPCTSLATTFCVLHNRHCKYLKLESSNPILHPQEFAYTVMLPPFPCPGSLYPMKVPRRARADDRPMEILALGLSRTGTDSLRTALGMLGYENVYHGFAVVEQETWTDGRAWRNLLDRKFNKGDTNIGEEDFDVILSDCSAVSDVPAVLFANELLDAYPKAAVILNKRLSTAEWKESFRNTTLAAEQSFVMRVLSYFNIELFWLQRTFEAVIWALFHGQFDAHAEAVYGKHYQRIEAKLSADGRPHLEWFVQDGWEPLCAFLKKDVPQFDFPTGNAKQDHDQRIAKLVGQRVSAAMATVVGISIGILTISFALWFSRP